jgi:hypothetical protein
MDRKGWTEITVSQLFLIHSPKEGPLRPLIGRKIRSLILAAVVPVVLGGCTVYETAPQADVAVAPAPPPPAAVVVSADAPPPDQVEVVGVAPWADGYWIRGHYIWRAGGWYWSRGYWGHRPYGRVWVGGYYRHGVYVGGYWR